MRGVTTGLSIIVSCGIAAGLIGGQALYAADQKEVYVTPNAEKQTLANEPLPKAEGKQITIDRFSVPPGWVGGRHYHTGPVYVYVLDGSLTMDEQGKPQRTFNPGQLYEEPIGTPMQARNLSTSEPTKILVIQITDKGEPLMYKADPAVGSTAPPAK